MLFSHPAVASFLNEGFECAWQSVRPVPRVEIDFGNGHRLTRTLNGNIATWFLTPDGRALDVLPGLVGPEELLARARDAKTLHETVPREDFGLEALVKLHHESWVSLGTSRLEALGAVTDMRKHRVEEPIKKQLSEQDLALADDTEYNRTHRYPKAHALLAKHPLGDPRALTEELFRDVLDVDLADPYLGLAPYVLGGERGRSDDRDGVRSAGGELSHAVNGEIALGERGLER